jgi:UDP-N-acetyl-D-glucosamine dehydrogenase
VAVIGLGYVGLPLAVELAQAGFRTLALDPDRGRVEAINLGRSYHPAVPSVALLTGLRAGKLSAHLAADYQRLRRCDAIAICRPAPLPQTGGPDPAALVTTVEAISDYLHPGLLLVLNGPVPLDLVQESLHPHLVRTGLALGRELFVACWPGGLEAGPQPQPRPRPVGLTDACTSLATAWYRLIDPAGEPQRSVVAREREPNRA